MSVSSLLVSSVELLERGMHSGSLSPHGILAMDMLERGLVARCVEKERRRRQVSATLRTRLAPPSLRSSPSPKPTRSLPFLVHASSALSNEMSFGTAPLAALASRRNVREAIVLLKRPLLRRATSLIATHTARPTRISSRLLSVDPLTVVALERAASSAHS